MNRHGLVLLNGLLLGVILVTSAHGQQSGNQRKSLSQRMSELRPDWTRGEQQAAPTEHFPTPQAEDGSLIPNWLSSGEQKQPNARAQQQSQNKPQQQNQTKQGVPQPNSGRYGQAASNQPHRKAPTQSPTAGGAQTSQQRSAPANNFTLPGLGGSPLPSTKSPTQQARTGSNAANRHAATPSTDSNYPVIRDVTTPGHSAAPATTAKDTARRSPARHTNPSFSNTATPAGPSARIAQADERPGMSAELPADPSEPQAIAADGAVSFPTIESTPQQPVGEEPQSAAEAFGTVPSSRPSIGASQFIRSPRSNAVPEQPSAARSKEAFGEALQVASGGDPSVLVSNQTPVISTDIRGPKQILVGREAVYRVRLQNQSASAADGIVVTIRIPSSAEVIATTPTQGAVQPSQNPNGGSSMQIEWQLSNLPARGSEVLDIRLVPRESRPMELGVSWTIAPVGSRAIVEVQEPQLKIEVDGPTEVLFDKPQVFKLTIANPGTGPAENVRIDLVPPGGTQDAATSHTLGNLEPGETKSLEIELTAREAGKLNMKAIASAEGGLTSDVSKEIFCRKPELEVDWRGPAAKYAGTPATYFFRVRNPGTAPAEDVTVQVTLPEAAEFNSASEGQQFTAETRQVTWRVGTLNPGDDTYMELKCVVKKPGANQFNIMAATAGGDLTDSKVAETNVEAIADLKLSVSDPSGPVAVGTPALYEIHVENRGANTARNINVVALFSEGIEPDQAEGGTYSVADGRVSFRAIEELPAGRDVTLRIRARALQPGTHVFRAEVLCSDLEIKLAAEETTRFYADEVMPDAEDSNEQTSSRHGFESAVR